MASSRGRWPLIAALFVVVGLPLYFLLGASAMAALHTLRGPAPGGGEGVQADAYSVIFVGGPVGVVVGGLLAGWLSFSFGDRMSWPVVAACLVGIILASAWALHILGSH